jgi:4-amino-4-deoxychorismate lyase
MLAGIKHRCRLEQVLAQLELRASEAQQGLLLDTRGYVVGGTSSNIFVVRGAELWTPAITRAGIKGVMRRVVLEAAAEIGLRSVERELTLGDVRTADELFMTNALFGIWPVAHLDERVLKIGRTTRRLMEHVGDARVA